MEIQIWGLPASLITSLPSGESSDAQFEMFAATDQHAGLQLLHLGGERSVEVTAKSKQPGPWPSATYAASQRGYQHERGGGPSHQLCHDPGVLFAKVGIADTNTTRMTTCSAMPGASFPTPVLTRDQDQRSWATIGSVRVGGGAPANAAGAVE